MRNSSLIVASIAAWLTLAVSAWAQPSGGSSQNQGGQSTQSIPDAPQPQKKAAAKPQPPPDAPARDASPAPATPADAGTPKQPAAKDENAFPEDVSRDAAKKATADGAAEDTSPSAPSSPADASDKTKPSTSAANPFPESVSRDAAKAAGNDPEPAPTAKRDLPPGVSSSQSTASSAEQSEPQVADPARAKKDTEVGNFYLKTGDYQGALLRYKDATAADPTNVAAIFGLAEAQRSLGKTADAARYYQMYLEIVPNGPKSKEAMKALKTLQPRK
jgi:tetratricopeptide (TPR) repeat protein